MMTIVGAILVVLGLVLAAVVVVAVPVLIGIMAYDTVKSTQGSSVAKQAAKSEDESIEAAGRRILVERGVARAFVIFGGVFWGIATFAGLYYFQETGWAAAAMAAGIPMFAALVTLVIGWYWERLASAMLAVASVAVVYWGVTHQFETGVWMLMTAALIGPMLTASALFFAARQEHLALEVRLSQPAELAVATVEQSSR